MSGDEGVPAVPECPDQTGKGISVHERPHFSLIIVNICAGAEPEAPAPVPGRRGADGEGAGLTGRARAGFALLRRGSASQILVLNLRLFREPMQEEEEEEAVEARSVRVRIASEVVASGTHVSRQEASCSLLYSGFLSCATPYLSQTCRCDARSLTAERPSFTEEDAILSQPHDLPSILSRPPPKLGAVHRRRGGEEGQALGLMRPRRGPSSARAKSGLTATVTGACEGGGAAGTWAVKFSSAKWGEDFQRMVFICV